MGIFISSGSTCSRHVNAFWIHSKLNHIGRIADELQAFTEWQTTNMIWFILIVQDSLAIESPAESLWQSFRRIISTCKYLTVSMSAGLTRGRDRYWIIEEICTFSSDRNGACEYRCTSAWTGNRKHAGISEGCREWEQGLEGPAKCQGREREAASDEIGADKGAYQEFCTKLCMQGSSRASVWPLAWLDAKLEGARQQLRLVQVGESQATVAFGSSRRDKGESFYFWKLKRKRQLLHQWKRPTKAPTKTYMPMGTLLLKCANASKETGNTWGSKRKGGWQTSSLFRHNSIAC